MGNHKLSPERELGKNTNTKPLPEMQLNPNANIFILSHEIQEDSNHTQETISTESICSPIFTMNSHDNTPLAFSFDTPDVSGVSTETVGIQTTQCLPFTFTNCLEYGAYHFIYVLSVRIMLAILIEPVGHVDQIIDPTSIHNSEHSVPLQTGPESDLMG